MRPTAGRTDGLLTIAALVAAVVLGLTLLTGCGESPSSSPHSGSDSSSLSPAPVVTIPSPTSTPVTSPPLSPAPTPSAPSTPSSVLTVTSEAPTPPTFPSTASTLVEGSYKATTVIRGLRVPWEMRFMPDGALLITERGGRVVLADVYSGTVSEVGRIEVATQGETGLLGLALDPDFPDTPAIYVTYTYPGDEGIKNRVSRFELTGLGADTPRLGRETVLVDGIPAGSIHDGSRVAFGPDGYLWVTMGDAGRGANAQRMDSLSGKVLRMNEEGQPASDNPFLDRAYPFSLVYTLGHRNPQGIAFHPVTLAPYITEHGPSTDDEVNRLRAGGNYGWPDLGGKVGRPGFTDPLVAWTPTIAPAGCLFYTGTTLENLRDTFLFVTLKESDLRVMVPADTDNFRAVIDEKILFDRQFGRLRAIAQGRDGALYLATSNRDGRGNPGPLDDRIIRVDPVLH